MDTLLLSLAQDEMETVMDARGDPFFSGKAESPAASRFPVTSTHPGENASPVWPTVGLGRSDAIIRKMMGIGTVRVGVPGVSLAS